MAAIAATALGRIALLDRGRTDPQPVRFFVSPPEGWRLKFTNSAGLAPFPLAVSPDGRRLAFVANGADGKDLLWIRPLDTLVAHPLAGTEGASSPFWSPDSQFLGFFAAGKVKTIDLLGSQPVTLTDAQADGGGAWNRQGIIVFGLRNSERALQKISAAGGAPTDATIHAAGDGRHWRPSFLPDGRHFLFTVGSAVYVASLDSAEQKQVLENTDSPTVLYANGRMFFVRGTALMAQAFDDRRFTLSGQAVPIVEIQRSTGYSAVSDVSVSADGAVLAYSAAPALRTALVWMDRSGKPVGTVGDAGEYWNIALSRDDKRLAVSMVAGIPSTRNVWVIDLARAINSQVTFPPVGGANPTWAPDGKQVAFFGTGALYRKDPDAVGTEQLLLKRPAWMTQSGSLNWSADGRSIIYSAFATETHWDLWIVSAEGDQKTTPFLQTRFDEDHGTFSPNGRWIGYSSNESGRAEIYVQPFPATGAKYRISRNGGIEPAWRGDGKELFFLAPDSTLIAVPIDTSTRFEPGVEQRLFATGLQVPEGLFSAIRTTNNNIYGARRRYAVTADGKRFLISRPEPSSTTSTPVTVVLNWTAALRK